MCVCVCVYEREREREREREKERCFVYFLICNTAHISLHDSDTQRILSFYSNLPYVMLRLFPFSLLVRERWLVLALGKPAAATTLRSLPSPTSIGDVIASASCIVI